MDRMLNHWIKTWQNAGYPSKVYPAPKDAQTFDKMLVVYSDNSCRMIRRVSFYDSRTDMMVGDF